jgi:REP element-mobilizing transposase RayT
MVAGYHLIWTAYGWWLPNDPRGSSSHEIRVERIAELGELHHGRKRVQPAGREIREFYREAKEVLAEEAREFDPQDVKVLAASFAILLGERGYTCYACAIMPDHLHMLIRRHRADRAERMVAQLQHAGQVGLVAANSRPEGHPVWGGPGWKVFLNTREDVERTIKYIEDNPIRARRPPQRWTFVKPYDGWLPHPNL